MWEDFIILLLKLVRDEILISRWDHVYIILDCLLVAYGFFGDNLNAILFEIGLERFTEIFVTVAPLIILLKPCFS